MIQSATSYATTKYAEQENKHFTLQQPTPALAVAITTIRTSKIIDATPTDTDIEQDNSKHFILIPFAVLLLIVALSALVRKLIMAMHVSTLNILYIVHRFLLMYTFAIMLRYS